MKKVVASFVLGLALVAAEHAYIDTLKAYLALKKEFQINGYFYYYDFDRDGYDYNDWIYLDRQSGRLYRLLAVKPTKDNAFGFAPVNLPSLPAKVTGYFVHIAMPGDDERFSWVYIEAESHRVYKLTGASSEGYMRYLDIDEDGRPDPLDVNVEIEDDVTFTLPNAITDITCGWYHTCYIEDGTGYCFGDNAYGELGDGTTSGGPMIKRVKLIDGLVQIDAAKEYTCALTNRGAVHCWGRNEYGKLGNGMVDKKQYPLSTIPASFIPFAHQPYTPLPQKVIKEPVGALAGATSLSTGSWHACAIGGEYTWCWGQNFDGALGIGKDPKSFMGMGAFDIAHDVYNLQTFFWPRALRVVRSATTPLPMTGAKSVAAGSSDHTCVITRDDTVRCWGWNSGAGELGIGDTRTEYYTAPALEVITKDKNVLQNVRKIVAGADHTCALSADHTVWCWGNNENGEISDGTYTPRPYAVQVLDKNKNPLQNIYEIFSDRGAHTCAIDHLGILYCWGSNARGELGIGKEYPNTPYAVEVSLPEPVLFGSAGGGGLSPFDPQIIPHKGEHTCAVSVNDHIYCWGDNQYGQLGTGDLSARYLPARIR